MVLLSVIRDGRLCKVGNGTIVVTPSTTNAESQYDTAIDKITALLRGSDIDVISTVSKRATENMASWSIKGSRPCLIFYETAEDAVARGLLKGELPSRVLEKWVLDAEVLLSKHRRRRRQLTFVSISAAVTEPKNFVSALSQRFKGQDFPSFRMKSEKLAWSVWQGLLARQIVSGEVNAIRLGDALDAAALPLAAHHYDSDVAASELNALQSDREEISAQLENVHVQTVGLAEAKIRQSNLEAERALLRDQIVHLQQAVQEYIYTSAEHQRELSAMKLTLTAAQDRVEGLEATLMGLTAQAARGKADMDALRNHNEGLETRIKELTTQAASDKVNIDALQEHIKGLEATLNGLASQAASDKSDIEALVAQKQKLLDTFNQLMVTILHGNGLKSWPWSSRRAQQIKIVRDYGVVDPDWYLQFHQDVAKAGAEPFRHYIDYGVKEGRPPNASFA